MTGQKFWRGAELVYRYGLGVMSLPESDETGHRHNAGAENALDHSNTPSMNNHGQHDH